jgi:single-strand DNA-binding protein
LVVYEQTLITRSYNDKQGNKKAVTEIEVNELLMMGGKEKQLE